jgi:hypothetical protein
LIHTIADADKTGTRIAVPRGDLVDVLLSKRLKQAELVRADTVVGAFELLQTGNADVCALPLPNLIQYSARLPGSRILDERFGVNRVGLWCPKGMMHISLISANLLSLRRHLALSSAPLSVLDYAVSKWRLLQTRAPNS